jgi:hypothetical protein
VRVPTATAGTHPSLARLVELLGYGRLSRVEEAQLLLEIADDWHRDPTETLHAVERLIRTGRGWSRDER